MRDGNRPRIVGERDASVTLDWASLGRLVRTRTLDAVAVHFVEVGIQGTRGRSSVATDEPRRWIER